MISTMPQGPIMSERFADALVAAFRFHSKQHRKGTDIPYISHLLAVAAIVLENGGSEDEAIAALLHDAVEDAGGAEARQRIRDEFGDQVVDIVDACSDTDVVPKPPWEQRKQAYLDHLAEPDVSESVLRVSLADKLHNARAILNDYGKVGDELWQRFNTASAADQLWYYRRLANVFRGFESPLEGADELDAVVTELELAMFNRIVCDVTEIEAGRGSCDRRPGHCSSETTPTVRAFT
jgi:(p)ppGpp synthase/HD superfamily hydrolase